MIWFQPLFPLCQWSWVQTWSASLGIPRPPPTTIYRTTSGFCRASAVFVSESFFGQLEKLHQILPGFRYIWKGRDGWRCFWRMRWTKMHKSPKSAAKPRTHFTVHTLPHGPSACQERWSPRARKAWNDFKGSTMQAASLGFPSWRQSCWLFLSPAAQTWTYSARCHQHSRALALAMEREGYEAQRFEWDQILRWSVCCKWCLCGGNRLWCQVFTAACLEGVFENMKGASLSMASGVKLVSCRRTVWRQDRLQKKKRCRVTIAKRGILGVAENGGFSPQIIPF